MRFLPTNQPWRYWSLERFLADVSELGARDVDLWLCNQHVHIDAHDVYNVDEIVGTCERYGVRVRTLTPEQSNPKAYDIASLDGCTQRLTRGYYEQIVRLAARLKALRISINGGWRLLDDDPARSWEAMVQAVRHICRIAASEGIDVCVEPLTGRSYRLVTDAEELLRVLEEVSQKNLYATLDTGTIARNHEDLGSYLAALAGGVGYVHLTNLDPKLFAHLGWGDPTGVLDPRVVLDELEAGGYAGDCALEMTKSAYYDDPHDALARSLDTLKGCER
jgi:sugar phosphate isomerase/epimerase